MAAPVDNIRILDSRKLMMFSEPNSEGKRAKLVWSIRDHGPRLSVFTNLSTDNNNSRGVINVLLDANVLFVFLRLLEDVANGPSDVKNKIETFTNYNIETQQRMETKINGPDLIFGKDAEGVVWLSLIANNRPKIKFNFTISDYYGIYKADGSQIVKAEASVLAALANVISLRHAYGGLLSQSFVGKTTEAIPTTTVDNKPDDAIFDDLNF